MREPVAVEVEEGVADRSPVGSVRFGPVGEDDATGDVGDAGVHDRSGHQREVVLGGVVRGARALAELQPAVAVVAEGHLARRTLNVGVGSVSSCDTS